MRTRRGRGSRRPHDAFDAKTGNKYESQVDAAQRKINEQVAPENPDDSQPH